MNGDIGHGSAQGKRSERTKIPPCTDAGDTQGRLLISSANRLRSYLWYAALAVLMLATGLPHAAWAAQAEAIVLAKGKAPSKPSVPVWAKKRGPSGLDKWNAKCRAGKRASRDNPAKAAIHPPACTRT